LEFVVGRRLSASVPGFGGGDSATRLTRCDHSPRRMANVAVAGTEVAGGVVLQVLFAERARDDTSLGTRHLGALHVPCCAQRRTRPSPADLARLRPLLRAHQAACAAQEEALDVQRLSSTFAPLMQLLREMAGVHAHRVALTPETLSPLLPDGGVAELAELPEGLLELAGELRDLNVSSPLTTLPAWVGELACLTRLELTGAALKELPPSIGQLGNLQGLVLRSCRQLEALPDVGKLTALTSLSLDGCSSLRDLPRSIGPLGASSLRLMSLECCDRLEALHDDVGRLSSLRRLHIQSCNQVERLPHSVEGLSALEDLKLSGCYTKLPAGIGALGALKKLSLCCHHLESLPEDMCKLSALTSLTLDGCNKLTGLPYALDQLTALQDLTIAHCAQLEKLPRRLRVNQEVLTSESAFTRMRLMLAMLREEKDASALGGEERTHGSHF